MTTGGGKTYQFGPFRLDPSERLLLRDGHVVSLTPKAFDLLVYLVEHQGRLVEKSTLMAALWPDTIVEEANLAFQVSAVRKALDDGGEGETLIQTVPTRGYRFVGAVTPSLAPVRGPVRPDGQTDVAAQVTGASGARRPRWRPTIVVAVASLAVLVGVFAAINWARRSPSSPSVAREPVVTRLTGNPKELPITSAQISPDGRYLAYADPTGIHVQFIDTGETQALPDTRGMAVYAWSGDSTTVRASACDTEMCVGWDMALVGGTRRRSGASWSVNEWVQAAPDGSRLLRIVDRRELRLDLLNGTPPRLLLRSAEMIQGAAWSVDGARIFYISFDGSAVKTLPVNGEVPRTVFTVRKNEAITDVVELANQRLVVVVSRGDPSGLARSRTQVSIQEVRTNSAGVAVGDSRVLTGWRQDRIVQLSASRDGARLAFLNILDESDIYIAGFDPAVGLTDTPKPLRIDDWSDGAISWTPDSTAVLFDSNRNDDSDIFRQRVDNGGLEPVAVGPGAQHRPEVTSDGRWILYVDHSPGGLDRIMRVPLSGGTAEPISTVTQWGLPRCSFRGRCVLEEWLGPDLVVTALDPVNGKGAELGRWRAPTLGFSLLADGSAAAFIVAAGGRRTVIRVVSLKGEPPRDIAVQNVANLNNLDPLPGGAGFLSRDDSAHPMALVFVRPDGTSRVLWSPTDVEVEGAIASPDGRHLAINTTITHGNAWMVSGF